MTHGCYSTDSFGKRMRDIQKAVLVIIDGWGIRVEKEWNAIAQARTPNYSRFLKEYPHAALEASGLKVGLPDGVMGNSEVGHMNIGSGRRVVQDQVRIHESIDDGSFFSNSVLKKQIRDAREKGRSLHLLGLVSQGNVHSAERHYVKLIEMVAQLKFPKEKLFVHAILDGRDTPPKSADAYLRTLEQALAVNGGRIATVSGRFFAMDRDKRWERTEAAFAAFTQGTGEKAKSGLDALQKAYARGETDEFVQPTVIEAVDGRFCNGDAIICFNFRPDRMRQIVSTFLKQLPQSPVVTFTRYDASFSVQVAFPPQTLDHCLGQTISEQKCSQFRTAETEKYAHVTYFLNGGREEPFPLEERLLIPSPKVKTYDVTPEMSSKEVTAAIVSRIGLAKDALIVVNFAHPDMIGHTGKYEAAIEAVESTDRCLGAISEASLEKSFSLFITADHGNVEMMKDPKTGAPHTAHTTNPVPFIAIGKNFKNSKMEPTGALSDVAPTLLASMGLSIPKQMSGANLLKS
jgi:2,3-bisphosphoglycerate-independent phosphoglycerate mutase